MNRDCTVYIDDIRMKFSVTWLGNFILFYLSNSVVS